MNECLHSYTRAIHLPDRGMKSYIEVSCKECGIIWDLAIQDLITEAKQKHQDLQQEIEVSL